MTRTEAYLLNKILEEQVEENFSKLYNSVDSLRAAYDKLHKNTPRTKQSYLDSHNFQYFDRCNFNSEIDKVKELADLAIKLDKVFESKILNFYHLTDRQAENLICRITYKLNHIYLENQPPRNNLNGEDAHCLILNENNAQFLVKSGIKRFNKNKNGGKNSKAIVTTFTRFIYAVIHNNAVITKDYITHTCGYFHCCNPDHMKPLQMIQTPNKFPSSIIPLHNYTHEGMRRFGT